MIIKDKRIIAGFIPLTPLYDDTSYQAYIIIEEKTFIRNTITSSFYLLNLFSKRRVKKDLYYPSYNKRSIATLNTYTNQIPVCQSKNITL